jgi:predicted kinase
MVRVDGQHEQADRAIDVTPSDLRTDRGDDVEPVADGAAAVRLIVPDPCVVVLIGPSGSGKSSFARRHFRADEVFSSDAWRERLGGREADQSVSAEAFAALYEAAADRLEGGRSTVIDATNLTLEARGQALDLAWRAAVPAVAVAFDLPLDVTLAWNEQRPGRRVGRGVVRQQHRRLRFWLPRLHREGFAATFIIDGVDALRRVEVVRRRGPASSVARPTG